MSRDGREIRRAAIAVIRGRRRFSAACVLPSSSAAPRRWGRLYWAFRIFPFARLADGALAEGGVPALSIPLVWRTVLLLGRP